MSRVAEPIFEHFRRLPATEKIQIVQQLWDDIADEVARLPLTPAQKQLLDERIDEHQASPYEVEAWPEARDEILRNL